MEIKPQLEGMFYRYKVVHNGRAVCCLNLARDKEDASFPILRPNLHPVYTPAGLPVSEQGAHNFPHHKGCWIGHGHIGDTNFYADAYIKRMGRIITHECPADVKGDAAVFDALFYWQSPEAQTFVEERRRMEIRVRGPMTIVRVTTTMTTPLDEIEFFREKHGFFHIRVLDCIDEDGGGVVLAENGKNKAADIFGTDGRWIDCRGKIGSQACGTLIGSPPDEPPQPLFARNYGTIALNPFQRQGRVLKRGEEMRYRYVCVAYDGHDLTPDRVYAEAFA